MLFRTSNISVFTSSDLPFLVFHGIVCGDLNYFRLSPCFSFPSFEEGLYLSVSDFSVYGLVGSIVVWLEFIYFL